MGSQENDLNYTVVQDRLAALFGVAPADREATVRGMLHGHSAERPAYWLQILLATGIATYGLVLGSTGVVIGAMLISPLMGPLVQLGVGLAIGSPFLVLRAGLRTCSSIAVVIGTAALLALAIPFRELTSEISARTSPNVLDLVIACFCALSAVYTSIKAGSETASTAAGTAIGIALVPPLCVVGYGFGTSNLDVATGAALLFTANFSAITLVASLGFITLGYARVDVPALEAQALDDVGSTGAIARIARRSQAIFRARWAPLLRLLMPMALVAAVFVPLRRALVEVTWQVRVRTAVQAMLDATPHAAMRSAVVEHHTIQVRVVVVGNTDDGAKLQRDLRDRIEAISGVQPGIEVLAVPDANTLRAIAAAERRPEPTIAPPPEPAVRAFRRELSETIARRWPSDVAGKALESAVKLRDGGATITVTHLGDPIGPPAARILEQTLSEDLGTAVTVVDDPLPLTQIGAPVADGVRWLSVVAPKIERATAVDGVRACVLVPELKAPPRGSVDPTAAAVLHAIESLQRRLGERVEIAPEQAWGFRASLTPCAPAAEAPNAAPSEAADAGVAPPIAR